MADWFNNDWQYRIKLTSVSTKVTWIGSVEPDNKATNDVWTETEVE